MRIIKTREVAKGIKILDKSVSLSKRMKDSFIRTKDRAGETQRPSEASPSDYAISHVQDKAQDVAEGTLRRLPNPKKKASKSIAQAKSHFQEVRNQSPAQRKQVAHEAQKAAQKAQNHAVALRRTANQAQTAASEAKGTLQQARARRQPQPPYSPRPGHPGKSVKSASPAGDAVKRTNKSFRETAVKGAKAVHKPIKTAEKSVKVAVKTAKQTAKTTQKTAQAAARAAKTAEKAARASAKVAARTAKTAARALTAMVKAAIAAIKGLVAAIAAGGWIAVLIILVICLIGLLVGSVFGIFFASEPDPASGQTVNSVIAEINDEYTAKLEDIVISNEHDSLDMSGARAGWKEVLAIYTVKTVSDPDNPMEVATMTEEKAAILRAVFWAMNEIAFSLEAVEVEVDVLDDDNVPTGETTTETTMVLRIVVSHRTSEEMAEQYGFDAEQLSWLEELLKPEYHMLWNGLLYGITAIGDGSMIGAAESQLGNIGGEPYWSWYGFSERVEWCAIFVSWCAEQCGFIDAGIIPRFSSCSTGVQWFEEKALWQDNTYIPNIGDIILFDWEVDGICDHVGIVESVSEGMVNTIEGNSSDSCARRAYELGSVKIFGYGTPDYPQE